MIGGIKRWFAEWNPSTVTMGAPVYPLLVLFGLNAVDELDRTAFAILLPDIRDHFGLSDAGALAIVSVTTIAVLLIEIPLSFYVDRGNRVRIATVGAAVWALFAFGTGLAVVVPMLVLMRIGAGVGRSVVTPTHGSLLSDYYAPASRVKVFSFHRQANSVGQIVGPLLGGGIAFFLGWRAPFFLLAIPTIVFVILALRLHEPERGYQDRLAAGATGDYLTTAEPSIPIRETVRTLYGVRTMRRIWCAAPFLAIALIGVSQLLGLVYKDIFGLNALERGVVAAAVEPLQIVGVFFAIPWVSRKALEEPGFLLRFVAITGVFNGVMLAVLAYAPHVSIAVVCHALVAGSIGTLAPAFYAMISIVSPSRVRAVSFTSVSVAGIPGIAVFLPTIGILSDAIGLQAAMLTLIPMLLAAGFILASARKFVADDMAAAFAPPPEAQAAVVGD